MKLEKKSLEDARAQMLSMGFTPERFEKEALNAIKIWEEPKNAYLRQCTTRSVVMALVDLAKTSLTLNPISKEAFLIPRKDTKTNQVLCHLEPSYTGLTKLLTDAGSVTSINTQLVYENDDFEINLAADQPVRHIPRVREKRGEIIGAYAIAKLATGEKQVEWMDVEEIKKIRETSESYKAYMKDKRKKSIWVDHFGEMCRKTVVKRIYKYLPRTDRMQYVDAAMDLTNKDWEASSSQVSFAESLINSSTLIESRKEQLYKELSTCDATGIELMIDYLQDHQPEPGTQGDIQSMGDVHDAMDRAEARDKELFDNS